MSGTATPQPSSDNFWSGSPHTYSSSLSFPHKKKEDNSLKEFLSSVDESPEFYDPYSDLNLFLSQKIKQEMQHSGCLRKWSLKIQEELIQKITPEFQSKFPQYRLGVAALKKIWEKISYYSQQIQHQKEAISQDGKLNIHFFIKENLKQYLNLNSSSPLHPFHYAHQLAMKMSECIATVDGIRPKLDHLTKLIWAMQRHLIIGGSPEKHKSPYDEYDKIDRLIVKTILEITAKEPQISQTELEHKAKESLHALHDLPSFSSLDAMTANVSALLAEKQYQTSTFHTHFFSEQKSAILNFIRRHSSLCKSSLMTPQLTDLVRRITALYTLVSQLPKTISEEELKQAILSCYPTIKADRPPLPQALYAFISAELVLLNKDEDNQPVDYVVQNIWSAYQEAILLPELKAQETNILEIVIWKSLSETEGLLEKLPYRIGQRIEEEIANLIIDNPTQSFSAIVQASVEFFRRAKELVLLKKWSEIERKIHMWAIQGDMLCRWIRLDPGSPLLKLIIEKFKSIKTPAKEINHQTFVSEIAQQFLKEHPELTIYAGQLALRIWILYKYAWYALFAQEKESSYDRFIQWHISYFLSRPFKITSEHLFKQMEEVIKKSIPLAPFNAERIKALILAMEKEPEAPSDEWNAQDLAHGE
jgi:hypothetical protein